MPLTRKNVILFWKLFVSCYIESSREESKIFLSLQLMSQLP